jgi:hypothetical protein
MVRRAVNIWLKLLAVGASALFCAVLLVSGPASAAPTTGGTTTGGTGYGPATAPATVTPTTAAPTAAPKTAPAIAFTGAEIELMAVIGVVAIGAGGTLVLVSRRRRSAQAAA